MSTDIEVNDSPYPDSVKAGIPKLPPTPKGWEKAPLKKYLYEVRRPAKLKNEEKYKLVTVKRSRGGAEEREWLTGKQIKTKTQFFVEEGDFLISKRQIVHGACAVVPKALHGAVVSNEYCILHSNGGIDIGFLNYLSHTLYFQQTCFHSSIGVHVEKMIFRQNKWLDWEFNIPPIREQREIVKFLSTIDRLINELQQALDSKAQRKRALLESLLTGNLRYSEFSSTKWKEVKIGEIAEINASTLGENTEQNYQFLYLDLSAIKNGCVKWPSKKIRFNEAPSRARRIIKNGDIIMAMVRPNLKGFAYIRSNSDDLICSTGFAVLTPKKEVLGEYIYQNLFTQKIESEIEGMLVGSGYPAINARDVASLSIFLPPYDEQRKIAAVLSAADREIDQLTQKLGAYKLQKKGLMQQLLTGKKRVGVAKSEAA